MWYLIGIKRKKESPGLTVESLDPGYLLMVGKANC